MTLAPYTGDAAGDHGFDETAGVEWDLNPDTVMVAAGGTVTLSPKIVSGTGTVRWELRRRCGITLAVTQGTVTSGQNGTITVTAGKTPGFYHYSVPGTDNAGVAQLQEGYILVGNPPALLSEQGTIRAGRRARISPFPSL